MSKTFKKLFCKWFGHNPTVVVGTLCFWIDYDKDPHMVTTNPKILKCKRCGQSPMNKMEIGSKEHPFTIDGMAGFDREVPKEGISLLLDEGYINHEN